MATRITSLPLGTSIDADDLIVIVDVDQDITKKISRETLETNLNLPANHTQNTDVGTSNSTFYINSGSIYFVMNQDSGSLSLASDISGSSLIPISASSINLSTGEVSGDFYVDGDFYGNVKHFYIDHPTKDGMKLVYSSIESPQNLIRINGNSEISNGEEVEIYLPNYVNSFTEFNEVTSINITPLFKYHNLYVKKFYYDLTNFNKILFGVEMNFIKRLWYKFKKKRIHFSWDITLERTDMPRLETEIKPKKRNR